MDTLHLNPAQIEDIGTIYKNNGHFHHIYSNCTEDQVLACKTLGVHALDIAQISDKSLMDLGSGWSRRWSRKQGKNDRLSERVLLQW